MRIVQLTPGYPPMLGGVENSVFELVKQLRLMGNDVVVVTAKPKSAISERNVLRLPARLRLEGAWGDVYFCPSIFKTLRTLQLDIIHTHTPRKLFAEFAAMLNISDKKRFPYVVSIRLINTSLPPILRASSGIYRKTIERIVFERAKRVIVQTEANKRRLARECHIREDKIEIVPNGVDTRLFNPRLSQLAARKKYGVQTEKVILFAGRLTTQKGAPHLIKAVSEVTKDFPELTVLMVGGGPQEDQLKTMARELKISEHFRFLGPVTHDEMPELLAAADIVAMPSMSESFPNIMLEAMAMERGLIATRVGVIPEILEDGHTAKLINAGDFKALADAIVLLLRDDKLRRETGRNARQLVEKKFSWTLVANKTLEIYREALEK